MGITTVKELNYGFGNNLEKKNQKHIIGTLR